MKSQIIKTSLVLFIAITSAFTNLNATDPGVGDYWVTIPASIESHVVKETGDNAVFYKFKKADGTTQFLFSINKVTFDQWTAIKSQLPDAKLLGQKNDKIFYAEVTNRTSMKGADKEAYAQAVAQLDGIVKSIKL